MATGLILAPQDKAFRHNLQVLRNATLQGHLGAPEFLQIIISGKAYVGSTARILGDDCFAYNTNEGEMRVNLQHVESVEVFF